MNTIIQELTKIGQNHIANGFALQRIGNSFTISEDKFRFKLSTAINIKKNNRNEVKVLNWFEDFWLYVKISYIPVPKPRKRKPVVPQIFFTLSIFQGNNEDNHKTQLFRAEWDNYEDTLKHHPQPHWHIYTNLKDVPENFNDYLSSSSDSFEKYIDSDNKIMRLDKFHFAMNAQWSKNKSDVHRISNCSDLANWFDGLLGHMRKELEYVKR